MFILFFITYIKNIFFKCEEPREKHTTVDQQYNTSLFHLTAISNLKEICGCKLMSFFDGM